MHLTLRLLMLAACMAWSGQASAATTTKSKSAKPPAKAPAKPETPDKDAASEKPETKAETPPPAAVSTVRIEDISGFEKYPKQVQSLVQSALALTHLELGYQYGSHEPNKGGMDCSGTVYHVLEFQGLKGVPRQSDEMCEWVEKKSHLHLTPSASAFDHAEFADLKPGDLLFWTNTMETKRKLPVTHVMIYLGKLTKSGKRIVFGASDGRSFEGHRRSGVSVFDFSLPKADSPTRFYGYGTAPGLLPATPPVVVATVPTPTALKEEVRKAVAIVTEAKPEAVAKPAPKTEPNKTAVAEPKAEPKAAVTTKQKAKTTTPVKAKTPTTKKVASSTTTKKRLPPAPQKNSVEKTLDRAVDSVRRFFR